VLILVGHLRLALQRVSLPYSNLVATVKSALKSEKGKKTEKKRRGKNVMRLENRRKTQDEGNREGGPGG
jgi:hypothetical protein